jgi:tetratricopeptide (TPR) repeat protein
MGKKKKAAPRSNVIPMQLDAAFFYERAVRSLDRCRYDKALRYFRKAVEYEPDNPVNHCNMAGILSEMGNYEESNNILKKVLDELDPSMSECWFYMANNYANMEMYEAAEEALFQYLEEDADGQFLEEAEEMMDLLHYELDRPPRQPVVKARGRLNDHDRARQLLEEGKFVEAVRLLKSIIEEQPGFLSARNNLALAYYYMGLFDQAADTVREVLDIDPGNLHALCNLAIFRMQGGGREEATAIVDALRKMVPMQSELAFKLATTMGILGEHRSAYAHFRRLLRELSGHRDPCLLHYTAVAACNIGRLEEAARLWKEVAQLDPESGVADYYLDHLDDLASGAMSPPNSYHYHLPFEEQLRRWEGSGDELPERMKRDPLVRSSFFWALRHGDRRMKLQVIQAFSLVGDDEVKAALREFLRQPEEDDMLKRVAIFVLRGIGDKEPVEAVLGGERVIVEANRMPAASSRWQAVAEAAMQRVKHRFDAMQQHDLLTLWAEFLQRLYPETPVIRKAEGWAAALEYLIALMHRQDVTIGETAARYGVSAATVGRHVRRIDEVCGITERLRAAAARADGAQAEDAQAEDARAENAQAEDAQAEDARAENARLADARLADARGETGGRPE